MLGGGLFCAIGTAVLLIDTLRLLTTLSNILILARVIHLTFQRSLAS